MIKYPKIETVFERDMEGNKKLIDGKFRDETVEFLEDAFWLGTEKIDGTNIGIVWDGYNVSFQGRTERAIIPPHLLSKLQEMFLGQTNEQIFEQLFGEKYVILFGEGYGPKIQNGGSYRSDVSFILFDVYFPNIDLWLERKQVVEVAKSLGIDCVPIAKIGTLKECIEYVKSKPKSLIGTADMEGLVCRPAVELKDKSGKRVIVKIKVRDFT